MRVRRLLLVAGCMAAAFIVGVAVGEALHDNPSSGGTQSIVRTLNPLPLAPAERTVTVTTTTP